MLYSIKRNDKWLPLPNPLSQPHPNSHVFVHWRDVRKKPGFYICSIVLDEDQLRQKTMPDENNKKCHIFVYFNEKNATFADEI